MNQNSHLKIVSRQTGDSVSRFDGMKWAVVVLLLIGGIVANTYFSQVAWAIRTAAGLVLVALMLLLLFQTAKGRVFWAFVQGARIELRKVVWPTRQETIQTALVVVVMVVIAALILWGLDTLFF